MPGFDAIGADVHFLDSAVCNGAYTLQIRVESAFGDIVSVTDIAAHHRFFAAYFTHFRHDCSPRFELIFC